MEWRIYVENKEVDAPEDISAQFTYAIDDIKDFATRNTSFSKTIVLPGTGRNKQIFGHIFEIGSSNFTNPTAPNVGYDFDASRAAKCLVTLDGLPVFKGILRVMEIVITGEQIEYETAVFGELGGLIAALGDKKLEDLDFSAYNHAYTLTNIQNSWTAAAGTGYYYGFIDYGYSQDKVNFRLESFRPAFHVKEYLDKILTAAGYTYTSTFLNSAFFKKLIVPFKDGYLPLTVSTVTKALDTTSPIPFNAAGVLVSFNTLVGTSYLPMVNSGTRFNYDRIDPVTLKLTYTSNYSIAGTPSAEIQVLKNGTEILFSQAVSSASGTINISGVVTLDPSDFIEIKGFIPTNGPVMTMTSGVFTLEGQPTVDIPLTAGETVDCNTALPKNELQKDFLASLIKLFNLYIDEAKDKEKHLIIEPYVGYYEITEPPVDWSGKLDRSQPYRLRPMSEMTARTYEYKYKDDSDFWNDYYKKKFGESYGTYVFDNGSEFVKDKQTIEIGFSPTPLVGYAGTDYVMSAIYKRDNGVDSPGVFNMRIMSRATAPIACTTWNMIVVGTGAGSFAFSSYPYCGHLDNPDAPNNDLNFGAPQEFYFRLVVAYLSANMFNVYWSFYISEITDKDSKLFLGKFNLSPQDITTLDFAKFIFIDGMLWRLNKIADYSTNSNEVTDCELLKVIDVQ